MANYKLWTNSKDDNAATAFMSAIKIQNHRWSWTENSSEADLWCVCTDGADIAGAVAGYETLIKKPAVAFLSSGFSSMPYPEWVYFRVPLNVSVLHNWLTSKNLGSAQTTQVGSARWLEQAFKLNYWPNVSAYSAGGSEIMMVCSRLLHGWCYYDDLLSFNVDKGTLDTMLADAVAEGNLVYGEDSSDLSLAAFPVIEDQEENVGLFKRIFSRFSKTNRA